MVLIDQYFMMTMPPCNDRLHFERPKKWKKIVDSY